jgi:hypothetical protein
MWARLASLLLLFFGLTHQGSAQRVPPPALRIQCQVSSVEWSDRQPGAAWLVSLRTADGKVLEEVVVPAQSNPQQLDLGSRRSGTYIVAAYFDANGNRKLDRGVFSNPVEPYAFSNNARNRFSEPDLADQRFTHPGDLQKLVLKPAF